MTINALTFDIEDWFHLLDIPSVADPAGWGALPTILPRHTRQIDRARSFPHCPHLALV